MPLEAYESTSIDAASGGADDHEHWSPEDGFERTVFTAFSNALTAIGYALILLSVMLVVQTWSGVRFSRGMATAD